MWTGFWIYVWPFCHSANINDKEILEKLPIFYCDRGFPLTVSDNNLRVNRIIVTGRCSILKQSPGGVLKNEACKFIKKETLGQVLSCEFCGISRKPPVAASIYEKVFWKNLPNFLENIYVEVSFIISCNFCSWHTQSRSSHPEVFCRKDVLRIFAKVTGKHLCQSLFFNKVAGLRLTTCIFIKKRLRYMSLLRTFF